jgi:hypothetical protein
VRDLKAVRRAGSGALVAVARNNDTLLLLQSVGPAQQTTTALRPR